MKDRIKTISIATLFILTSIGFNPAFATVDFTYDISDTSWATTLSTPTFKSGDTLTVQFTDSANLFNLQNSDLLSWTWNVGANSATYSSFGFTGGAGVVEHFFEYDGTFMDMQIGGAGEGAPLLAIYNDAPGGFGQIGTGQGPGGGPFSLFFSDTGLQDCKCVFATGGASFVYQGILDDAGIAPFSSFRQNPIDSSFGGYGVIFDGTNFTIDVEIGTVGDPLPNNVKNTWEQGIEGFWGNQVTVSDGVFTYPILIDVSFNSNATNPDYVVIVKDDYCQSEVNVISDWCTLPMTNLSGTFLVPYRNNLISLLV